MIIVNIYFYQNLVQYLHKLIQRILNLDIIILKNSVNYFQNYLKGNHLFLNALQIYNNHIIHNYQYFNCKFRLLNIILNFINLVFLSYYLFNFHFILKYNKSSNTAMHLALNLGRSLTFILLISHIQVEIYINFQNLSQIFYLILKFP